MAALSQNKKKSAALVISLMVVAAMMLNVIGIAEHLQFLTGFAIGLMLVGIAAGVALLKGRS